jgi:hypothetical protein
MPALLALLCWIKHKASGSFLPSNKLFTLVVVFIIFVLCFDKKNHTETDLAQMIMFLMVKLIHPDLIWLLYIYS